MLDKEKCGKTHRAANNQFSPTDLKKKWIFFKSICFAGPDLPEKPRHSRLIPNSVFAGETRVQAQPRSNQLIFLIN